MADLEYDPKEFADAEYARRYPGAFNLFVELRVQGKPREQAVIEAFELIKHGVDLSNLHKLAFAADINPYVQERFNKLLESKDPKKDMWSERKAVNRLLQLIEDHSVRDSTRLNAINALNVLLGYVQLDDATSRRVGHTLADFARLDSDWKDISGSEKADKHDPRKVH